MNRLLPLLCVLGCAEAGRQPVQIDVYVELTPTPLSWGLWTAELDTATLRLAQLALREPDDGRWGEDRFDDRPSDPRTAGVAGAVWAGERKVDLLGTEGGALGTLEGYEGELVSADFEVRSARGSRVEGEVAYGRGAGRPFVLTLPHLVEVRDLPIAVTLGADDPTHRLRWTLDLRAALSHVDWDEARDDPALAEGTHRRANRAFAYGLSEAASWTLESE